MHHEIRWTAQKIAQRITLIEPLVYSQRFPLPPFRYKELSGLTEEPPYEVGVKDRKWEVVTSPGYWSAWEKNFILRTTFTVPDLPAGTPVVLHLPLGEFGTLRHPEALAYIDGTAFAGVDRNHHELRLTESMCDGKKHHLAVAGWTSFAPGHSSRPFMRECSLAVLSQPTRDFIITARVALGTANALPEESPVRSALLNALEKSFLCLDIREPLEASESFYASVPAAHQTLLAGIRAAGAPMDIDVFAAGHAHIDVAWLWTLNHTRQKARRTFYTALRMMDLFPEYSFSQSQPQLYDFIRQIDPALFAGIQQRVKDGRWEVLGGMWVEADCNLSGSESLARQFLLGRAFFREHFGAEAESPVLWLPDVFGYAWNLPQLIKEAGMEYFFTIKIGWNQYNRLPYDSFWWQGLDGTRVLTHFSTTPEKPGARASTYNAEMTPDKVYGTWGNFQQKELVNAPLLMSYGHGDGGGGPERAMLENLQEMKAFPGLPQVHAGKVGDFFRRLEETAGDQLPVWNGELYLEYHRGTYTSQSRNKRGNRKSEFALHDAEFFASQAALLSPAFTYPHDKLRQAWELVCLNQFHDILPGSSIQEVYQESQQQYGEVLQQAAGVTGSALESIAARLGGNLLAGNPTGFLRQDLAYWHGKVPDGKMIVDAAGRALDWQETEHGTWIDLGRVEPYSIRPLQFADAAGSGTAARTPPEMIASPSLLENDCLQVAFNGDGDITRIYDKVNRREVMAPGSVANQWIAYEDRPMYWDAWDVDIFYDEKHWLAEPAESIRVVEAGPLRVSLEIKRKILGSSYTQTVSLQRGSPRLDFNTKIDWRERHILLKAAFPVDVLSPTATYEVQWGNVERPTHRNTSWDWARFETSAHKWVDLSEGDYGISLMNDCKYGHDIRENCIRISLLRSPTSPDPEADQGEQEFAYSLLPHAGRWDVDTVSAAYAINDPLTVYAVETPAQPAAAALPPLVSLDRKNLVIETIKQAEDGQGWIVRLYEMQRSRGTATLCVPFAVQQAWRANIIEEKQSELPVKDGKISFSFHPYEIITICLQAAG